GYKGDVGKRPWLRGSVACVLAALLPMLAGCGGTPVRGDLEPRPAPGAETQAPSAATAPVTVEATVVTQPLGRSVYRIIRVQVPKGIDSLSFVIPEDTLPPVAEPAASAPALGGEKECTDGFFSCSKLVAETVSAVVAAILALLGLYKVLRKKRGKR
ncbi:MAG TPA: hypothetical protein VGT42_02830, partial [Gammaproteobacteria bacterium]|nr:hypothetical protein [Gammaproteobacteria bacterium]